MKPRGGAGALRGGPGGLDEDLMYDDVLDNTDILPHDREQNEKQIDADFFNAFPDDFDEEDMKPTEAKPVPNAA